MIKRIRINLLNHYKSLLKLAFASFLIALIIYESRLQIQSIHPVATLHLIRSIPAQWLFLFFLLGIIASAAMVLYDAFGIKAFQYEISRKDLFAISFLSNSLNTLLGFGGLTGASIKTLLLKKELPEPKEMLFYHAILVSSATTGLSVLSIMAFLAYPSIAPLLQQHKWLIVCFVAFIFYLVPYFFMDRLLKRLKTRADEFGFSKLSKLRIRLLAVSSLEWVLAGLLFYSLVFYFHKDQQLITVLAVFAASSAAGILSFLPGGIGSFDLIALIGLQFTGLTPNEALTVVILYRIFYFILPSGAAIINFALQILRKSEERGSVIKSEAYGQLIATVMAIIAIACGLLLLLSALTPSLLSRSRLITHMEAIVFLQYSRSISIAIGLMLLVTAKEIFLRVKRAYTITMILLFAGGIATFIKGFDIEEFFFITISMGIMRLSKTNFYRSSVLTKTSHMITAALAVLLLLIGYLKASHILFSSYIRSFHYPHLIFHDVHTFIHSGVIAYTLFLSFIIIWHLKRTNIERDPRFQKFNKDLADQFFKSNQGHHLSHLIYLGDKNLFLACKGQVLIAYSLYSDKAIVLGDPMGEKDLLSNGIQEFQSFIDAYGYRAAFYEVNEDMLSLYHDNGYFFFKLGEEAVVDLEGFDMTGSSRRNFRNIVNRFEKDGYRFEVLKPPFHDELLNELQRISSEWLGRRNEMGFSIGWFRREYLQNASIAIVRNLSDNSIIAFVSLMPQGKDSQSIGIDLMRFKSNVPNSTMDFIFIQLLLHFKEQGYRHFSFGVAPLAKVGSAPRSHKTEKIAHFVYKHGNPIYRFEGLRKFKDKFGPHWEPKYLAYPQLVSLPALLIEISMLVNQKKKSVFRKLD